MKKFCVLSLVISLTLIMVVAPFVSRTQVIGAFSADKVYELYGYVKDPLEKVNVVNDKKYNAISKDRYNKMIGFLKCTSTDSGEIVFKKKFIVK